MKSFKKSLMALAAVSALSVTGSANAYLQNWFVDTDGAGAGAGVSVLDHLVIAGSALVTNTFSSPTNFTFKEAGSFTSTQADFGLTDLDSTLKAKFSGTGTGLLGAPAGSLSFTGGSLELFSGLNSIGTFMLIDGGASLGNNSVLPNDVVSFVFKATSLTAGYFFTDATKTVDFSNIVSSPDGLLFGFATTNATALTGNAAAAAIGANQGLYTSTFGAAFDPTNAPGVNSLVLTNAGQFRFEVPEPGSLALIGLGLLGAGVARRRKVVAK